MEYDVQTFLALQLADELYALSGNCVREITRWRTPTVVPGTPSSLPGIINQRGSILPVVVPHVLLGLTAPAGPERMTRYVIAHYHDTEFALLVDAVLDLIDLPATEIEPLPDSFEPQRARLLQGLSRFENRPLALLDLPALTSILQAGA
jgi:purine-binding chemotaxis protein CheW